MFVIKLKDEGDVFSEEFTTHQEALWHLCHSPEYAEAGEGRQEREKVFYIDEVEHWEEEELICPKCGAIAGWLDNERDVIACYHCGNFQPY